MKLEGIIKKQLKETRQCNTKNAIVECLFKKGYVIINLKKFPKKLARVIRKDKG